MLDNIDREPGFDELRYLFSVANLVPRGQFYLRASNSKVKFVVPGANVKYPASWKEEWIVVGGDWGRIAFIGGYEYPVPTQFSLKDKWERREPRLESQAIIQGIMERGYINRSFPLLDPYDGARLEKYLQISAPLPGN